MQDDNEMKYSDKIYGDEKPSLGLAVQKAWDRQYRMLFCPFNMEKWFVLGFCSFLAYLGKGGGANFNYNRSFSHSGGSGNEMQQVMQFISEHLSMIIIIAVSIIVIILAIVVVLLWLSSRGQFMFLDGVARNRGAVVEPWKKFKVPANQLFVFRAIVLVIDLVVNLAIFAFIVISLFTPLKGFFNGDGGLYWEPQHWTYLGIGVGSFLIFAIATSLLIAIVKDFAVPVMYRYTVTPLQALRVVWHEFIAHNIGGIILFYIMKLLLGFLSGIIFIVLSIVTCCIFFCLSAIPYVGMVLWLPYYVFIRSYSLYYMAQFGDEWNVFEAPMEYVVDEDDDGENEGDVENTSEDEHSWNTTQDMT